MQQPAVEQDGVADILGRELTKQYVKFFTGIYALVGAGLGLGILFVGIVGAQPFTPELNSIVEEPLRSSVGNVDAIVQQMHVNRVATQVLNVVPIAAAVIGIAGGIYAGNNLDWSDRETYITAGASTFVGSAVLTLLVGAIASTQVAPIPTPELQGDAGQAVEQQSMADAGMGAIEGISSAILVGGTSLSVQNLAIYGVLVGAAAAVVAVGGVYVTRNLTPEQ